MTGFTHIDLRVWRARESLSQAELGKLFGVGQRSISQWESGLLPVQFQERFLAVLTAFYDKEKKK